MKNRLIYQSTEFDCGPTTIVNALRFLFEREHLCPDIVKGVWSLCCDAFNDQGEQGKHGTSKAMICYLAHWLSNYGQCCRLPVRARFVDGHEADMVEGSPTLTCLKEGGVALMRCWSGGIGHYVLLTTLMADGRVGLFDPYDEPDEEVGPAPGLEIVHDQPYRYNRVLPMTTLNLEDETDYAMGDQDRRENLLIWNTCTREGVQPPDLRSQLAAGKSRAPMA